MEFLDLRNKAVRLNNSEMRNTTPPDESTAEHAASKKDTIHSIFKL